MNSVATRVRPDWRTLILWTLLAVALALYFYVPVSAVLDASLDASNYASYTRFAAQRLQFGTEVVPMAGPYGYVFYGWVYNGDLYGTRLVLELVTKFILGLLVLWFFRRTRGSVTSWCWLLINLLVLPTTGELTYDLPVLYAALFLLFERPRWPLTLLTVSFLAFLALCKGTQLIFTLAVLAVVCGETAWRRSWGHLVWILGGFFGALVFLWVLAGQSIGNLPAYIRNIQELSQGYVSGMALQESALTFWIGVASVTIAAINLLLLVIPHRRNSAIVAGAVILAGFTFLQWKHGFVRADGHVFLFFHYCILGGCTMLLLDRVAGERVQWFGVRVALTLAGVALALYGDGQNIGIRFREYGNVLAHHLPTTLRQVLRPMADHASFEKTLSENRVRFALPEIADRVGRASIGFFGYQSGYLQLNRLEERPSPVAGGGPFSVFTPHLQQLNAQHILSQTTRPDYYLIKLQTIDERFVPQDDAQSLNALLHTYRPVLAERGMLLVKKSDDPSSVPSLRQLQRLEFRLGDELTVPAVEPSEWVLAAFELPSSSRGMLRSALYKSAIVSLHVNAAGASTPVTRRIIPSMASAPFIVSPVLDATEDLLSIYTPGKGAVAQTLKVTADPADSLAIDRCSVTFYAQSRPSPVEESLDRALVEQFSYPVANRAPELVDSPNARVQEIDGRSVQLLEPPGRIVFNLRGDERELLFDYGFDPEAYTRGTSDGADFIVELVPSDGSPEQIFLSRRDPRAVEADQGRHEAHLWLPVLKPNTKLQLRTTGGIRGATDWDWTFFDNIRLHHGSLNLAQFPGFSAVPVAVEGASPRMIKHDNRDALLLNAPGKLAFELTGTEHAVRFFAGLIPGAYLEGNTDGAEIIVEIQKADGTIDVVFQRWLQPKTNEGDRGTQEFDVALPPHPAGTRLIIRTTPGPHSDASWDWSYLGAVRFSTQP